RTAELRRIVAQRAVSLYTGSGSDGVDTLDTTNANDLATRQTYTAAAEQRDRLAVYQLKRAQEDLAIRKADAEQARGTASAKKSQLDAVQAELKSGDAKLREMKRGIDSEISALVQQAEQERLAREKAAADAARAAQAPAPSQLVSSNGGGSIGGTP